MKFARYGTVIVPGSDPGAPRVGESRSSYDFRNMSPEQWAAANSVIQGVRAGQEFWDGSKWIFVPMGKTWQEIAASFKSSTGPQVVPARTSTMSGNSRMLLILGLGLAAGLVIFRR